MASAESPIRYAVQNNFIDELQEHEWLLIDEADQYTLNDP